MRRAPRSRLKSDWKGKKLGVIQSARSNGGNQQGKGRVFDPRRGLLSIERGYSEDTEAEQSRIEY